MNSNFHFHPSANPRIYLLHPYNFCKVSVQTGEEICVEDTDCSIAPFTVSSFNEIRTKICSILNLTASCKVTIDTIGDEDYDEGFTFGNSLAIYVRSDEYEFCVSVDCYTSFNACQWLENNKSKY